MAKRILGMGDVVGIIETAQANADAASAAEAERMLREGFTMDDMLAQMQQIRKMGGMGKILGMLPGGDKALRQMGGDNSEEQMRQIESIIFSMTKQERARPGIINGMRRQRIARGSGHSVQDVNRLIKQWSELNKMMGKMRGMMGSGNRKQAKRQMQQMMRQMGGGMPGGMGMPGGKLPF